MHLSRPAGRGSPRSRSHGIGCHPPSPAIQDTLPISPPIPNHTSKPLFGRLGYISKGSGIRPLPSLESLPTRNPFAEFLQILNETPQPGTAAECLTPYVVITTRLSRYTQGILSLQLEAHSPGGPLWGQGGQGLGVACICHLPPPLLGPRGLRRGHFYLHSLQSSDRRFHENSFDIAHGDSSISSTTQSRSLESLTGHTPRRPHHRIKVTGKRKPFISPRLQQCHDALAAAGNI